MSLAEEIRDALKNAGGPLSVEEIYAKCPSAAAVDQIPTNISAFVSRGEVQTQVVLGQRARSYIINPNYVKGRPETGTTPAPRKINGRDNRGDASDLPQLKASAGRPLDDAGPTKLRKVRVKKVKKVKKPKVDKNAAVKKERVARTKKAAKSSFKRPYKKREAAPAAPLTPATDAAPPAVFGIRDDGALGITDREEKNVRLTREDVQRLQTFLETTEPLWI